MFSCNFGMFSHSDLLSGTLLKNNPINIKAFKLCNTIIVCQHFYLCVWFVPLLLSTRCCPSTSPSDWFLMKYLALTFIWGEGQFSTRIGFCYCEGSSFHNALPFILQGWWVNQESTGFQLPVPQLALPSSECSSYLVLQTHSSAW